MARNINGFHINYEAMFEDQFQIDGNFRHLNEIEEEFGVSHKEFFTQVQRKNDYFVDNKGVSHRVDWVHPDFQRIMDTHKDADKRLKLLKSRNFFMMIKEKFLLLHCLVFQSI